MSPDKIDLSMQLLLDGGSIPDSTYHVPGTGTRQLEDHAWLLPRLPCTGVSTWYLTLIYIIQLRVLLFDTLS